ncbi:MAG: metallophosphoesterase [Candidatus Dormiibacterota bacterium]
MTARSRRRRQVMRLPALFVAAVCAAGAVSLISAAPVAAAGPSPIPVTPFAGFNSLLTRAPYVTDLTQTGADVSWATTSSALGTLDWGPLGSCGAYQAPVPSSLPDSYPAAGTPPSITNPQFSVVSGTNEYQSTVVLSGLSPGTTYCYRPLATGGVDLLGSNPSQQFTTLAPVGSANPLTFDVVGDIGETLYSSTTAFPNNLNTDQAAIDSLIGSSGAQFVVTAGDVGYSGGTQANYGDLENGGSEVSDIFGPSYWPQTQGLPVFPGEGNHGQNTIGLRTWPEANTAAASGGAYAYDSYPANSQDGTNAGSYPDGWYAFSTDNVRIYVIDVAWADGSNVGTATGSACTAAGEDACPGYQVDHDVHWTTSSPEYKWLAADLASHPGTVKLAVWHYPLRSDETTQDSDVYLQNSPVNPYQSSSLESLLAANGVQVVFNGHAHDYQRISPSGTGQITNYVTGGGGGVLEPVETGSACSSFQSSGAIYAIGWSPTSSTGTACGAPTPQSAAQVYNFLKVTVSGGTMTVTPINAAGQSFDVQSYTYSTTPAVVIDTPPPAQTNSTSASIAFHASSGSPPFTCSLDGATSTSCTSPVDLTGLAEGSHTFTVAASGDTSATAKWTVDTTPPSTPTITSGTAASPTQVNLTWTASTDSVGVTGYNVYRNGLLLTSTPVSSTSYTDTTASPGTTYQYTVDALDGAGNVSPQSSPYPVTTPAGSAGPAMVQSAGSSTTTVTLAVPSTAGDLLVLTSSLYTGATHPITAVRDSAGNVWTKVGAYFISGLNSDGELWYAADAKSASTVTVTTGATAVALQLEEFSGVATSSPLDASNGGTGRSTAATSGTAAPTASGDLAVGFIAGHATAQAISVTSPGYTTQPMQSTTSPSSVTVVSGYLDLAATGSQSFSGSFGASMTWAAGVALFKPGTPPPPPGDFTIADSPGGQTVTAGSPATSSITTTAIGTPQLVALSATGLPAGAAVSFNPQSVTAGGAGSQMTITTSASTPAGTYPLTVTGTSTSAQHSAGFSLVVQTPPAITSPSSTSFTTDVAGSFTVTTTGSPTPSLSESGSLPTGVTFTDNGNGTATLSGTATSPSSSTITITATNAVTSGQQTFTLNVVAPVTNDFSISDSPGSAAVTQGGQATSTVSTAVTSGSAQTVTLSASGAPTGATVSFNPQSLSAGQSSTMTVTTTSSTPTGGSTLTITGTGTSATHSTTFSLTVNPAPAGPVLVQTGSAIETAAATSLAGSFPTISTGGDLLVLTASVYSGATNRITSVTDSAGNTWTEVSAFDTSGHYSDGEIWYAANAKATTTVTVHVATATTISFEILEFSGVATSAPLDASAGASNTGTSASSGSATASSANELVVGFVAGHGNAEALTPNAAGYTTEPQQTSTGTNTVSVVSGYEVLPTTGSTAFSANFGSAMYWAAGVAIFKP